MIEGCKLAIEKIVKDEQKSSPKEIQKSERKIRYEISSICLRTLRDLRKTARQRFVLPYCFLAQSFVDGKGIAPLI